MNFKQPRSIHDFQSPTEYLSKNSARLNYGLALQREAVFRAAMVAACKFADISPGYCDRKTRHKNISLLLKVTIRVVERALLDADDVRQWPQNEWVSVIALRILEQRYFKSIELKS